jgi:hypothetical protein
MRHWAARQSCRVCTTIGSPSFSPTGGCTTSPSFSITTSPSFADANQRGGAATPSPRYEANGPVVIAAVAIRPSDYIFADASGAVVIPVGYVHAVLR